MKFYLVFAYKDALQKELPTPLKQLLTTQYEHIQKSHTSAS
jgi:hypothetical protein